MGELLSAGPWRFQDTQRVTIVCAQIPEGLGSALLNYEPDSSELASFADLDRLFELHGHIRAATSVVVVDALDEAYSARACSDLIHELSHNAGRPKKAVLSAPRQFHGASTGELLDIAIPTAGQTTSENLKSASWLNEVRPPGDVIIRPATLLAAADVGLPSKESIITDSRWVDHVARFTLSLLRLIDSYGKGLLRILDHRLAVLWQVLVRVLAALSLLIRRVGFVFAVIAACRRYGRRDEPGHDRSPSLSLCRISLGRVATAN